MTDTPGTDDPDTCPAREFHRRPAVLCGECGWKEPVSGIDLVAAERQRQITDEGYTIEHDANHDGANSPLARAAACYAIPDGWRDLRGGEDPAVPALWPWERKDWKPTPDDRVRELVKAAALIVAEIDRLQAEK